MLEHPKISNLIYTYICHRNHRTLYSVVEDAPNTLQDLIDNNLYGYVQETLSDVRTNFALELSTQLFTGLDYLHSCNVIHGHLKPSSILITKHSSKMHDLERGRFDLKIADIGQYPQHYRVGTSLPDKSFEEDLTSTSRYREIV